MKTLLLSLLITLGLCFDVVYDWFKNATISDLLTLFLFIACGLAYYGTHKSAQNEQ